jgi:KaiC/GvpD/RAD55 family RecA-like ATPase
MQDCQAGVINYLEKPILVEGTITGLTGNPGCGKSSLACAIARRVHKTGRPVLLLDRDNPKVAVEERFRRLGMSDDETFRVWGGWTGEEAPQPASSIVLEWVMSCEPRPLVIIDSLSPFHRGNQNDAGEMRAFMEQCRRIADLGGSVIVLHHDGKAETAKDYRGSSDFPAALDAAFHVLNVGEDGRLGKLVLHCYKSRFGFAGDLIYDYADGQLLQRQEPEVASQTVTEQLTALLRTNPGVGSKRFEDLANDRRLGRNRAREFLNGGVLSGKIRSEPGRGNAKRHFLSTAALSNSG